MIFIKLTEQEALALRNLLDTAVRAAGMQAAAVALAIDAKIVEAAKAAQQQDQSPQPPKGNGGLSDRPAQ